jgi:hypothetical protein
MKNTRREFVKTLGVIPAVAAASVRAARGVIIRALIMSVGHGLSVPGYLLEPERKG